MAAAFLNSARKKALAGAVACAAIIGIGAATWLDGADNIADVHQGIAAAYPGVSHIGPQEFAAREPADLVIFDTREAGEFAVSHLRGAIHITPDMPPEDFLAQFGDTVRGKTAVFYCSVGARSTQFADQVQSVLRERGAVDVVNLEQGLFGWHNGARPLVSQSGQSTRAIHPYDDFWGRLIDDETRISRQPENF